MRYHVGHHLLIRVCTLLAGLFAGGIFTTAQVSADPARWMGELATPPGVPSPLDQTLAQFIFPGSHNAGSYRMKLAPACEDVALDRSAPSWKYRASKCCSAPWRSPGALEPGISTVFFTR
jgi:hypothetical protein